MAREAATGSRGAVWAVVLDLDETVLNNQTYQLERAAYQAPFDTDSWNAWVRVLAYMGDNIGDLPEADEEPGEYGVNGIVLPNPSYGWWERVVTRKQD